MIERNTLHCADALDFLRRLPDASIDAVITDPPYPEVDREYGRITEDQFLALIKSLIVEIRRVLTARGSAMFVLQPNSEHVGRMRPWLWDLMSWICREWNIVQDAYWWNFTAMGTVHCSRGLMRPSVKTLVWMGAPDCYRDQTTVLWKPSEATFALDLSDRALKYHPSGHHVRKGLILESVLKKGGSSPFNCLPLSNADSVNSGGANGHGASTPYKLVEWWVRYISKSGDLILDPFMGSGTTALVARQWARDYIGCDSSPEYVAIARKRLDAPYTLPLLPEEVKREVYEQKALEESAD